MGEKRSARPDGPAGRDVWECDAQAKMPPGSSPCAKYRTKASATIHIRGWISSNLPRATLISTQAMKPAPMPFVMLNVNGIRMSVRSAGRPSSTFVKSMSLMSVAIRYPTRTSTGTGGHERNERRERGDEDGEQEQDADHHGGQPGSPSLRHARGALDVAGVRADARRSARRGADRVDEQQPPDAGDASVLIGQARLLDDAGGRSHRVEEVGQHEREDREQRRADPEHGKDLGDVELPEGREAGRDLERLGGLCHAEHERDDRRDDDADDERARHLADEEDDRQEEPKQEDAEGCRVREDEEHRDRAVRVRVVDDQTGVDEADEQDEEPDPDADRALQPERHGVHDGLPEADEHEQQDDEALEDDHPHRARGRQPLAEDEAERHGTVDAEPSGECDRIVADDPHQDAQHAGHQRRAGRNGCRIEAGRREDVGVHEDDVGHDHEGGQACTHLAADGGPPLSELEEGVEPALRRRRRTASLLGTSVASASTRVTLQLKGTREPDIMLGTDAAAQPTPAPLRPMPDFDARGVSGG